MAKRPLSVQNWQERSFVSFGPKFRLDMNNPSMGLNGSDVYNFYAVTNNNDVSVTGLSEGGLYKIYNDHSIEIVGGQKSQSKSVDIMIVGKNGDVCITAEKNGSVRVRGTNVIIDADKDVNIVSGRDVTIKAKGRFLVQSNQADCDALMGNLTPRKSSFLERVFEGTFVGQDILSNLTGGIINKIF